MPGLKWLPLYPTHCSYLHPNVRLVLWASANLSSCTSSDWHTPLAYWLELPQQWLALFLQAPSQVTAAATLHASWPARRGHCPRRGWKTSGNCREIKTPWGQPCPVGGGGQWLLFPSFFTPETLLRCNIPTTFLKTSSEATQSARLSQSFG